MVRLVDTDRRVGTAAIVRHSRSGNISKLDEMILIGEKSAG